MTTNDTLISDSFNNFSGSDTTDCLLFGPENFSSELDEELVEIDLMIEAQETAPSSTDDNEFGSYTAYVHSFRTITPPSIPSVSMEEESRTISRSRDHLEACVHNFANF